jgi:plastocyanin
MNQRRQHLAEGKRRRLMALLLTVPFAAIGAVSFAQNTPKNHTVVIDGMQFSPSTIEVSVGDTVTWVNKDPFPHTATAQDKSFDSGDLQSGHSWKFKVRKKGTFPYVCTLHSTMKGVLVVK